MDSIDRIMTEIEQELEIFQWSYGVKRGDNRGEVSVDRANSRLCLEVWCADNDNDEDDNLKPLNVSIDINTYDEPRQQVRNLIHLYLCHEADEQIWFGEERPFYPH